jgi:cell division protein ZapA (FtsZ GTPase activity inhibitor)
LLAKAYLRVILSLEADRGQFMSQKNQLFQTPPYAVEEAIKYLGQNLRIARRRRRLSIAQVAEKIGAGVRVISDAEKGKPSTAVAVYTALLWVYDLLENMREVASPLADAEGLRLAALREAHSGRLPKSEPDNDF